jgi:hypothetical protein
MTGTFVINHAGEGDGEHVSLALLNESGDLFYREFHYPRDDDWAIWKDYEAE